MKKKTTISLPRKIHEELMRAAIQCRCHPRKIILLCLKRQKKKGITPLSKRLTVRYNQSPCEKQVTLVLDESEHNYLQATRFFQKISVSYIIAIALKKFIRLLKQLLEQPQLRKGVHKRVVFQNRTIARAVVLIIDH